MDLNVYPGSRIERLPGALKWPAIAARNVRDGISRSGSWRERWGSSTSATVLALLTIRRSETTQVSSMPIRKL